MGRVVEDLWEHEGYAARRLADGTLTGTGTAATAAVTALVAACGCGWHSTVAYLPTDDGEELALDQWTLEHAEPLLHHQAERRQERLARALGWLGDQVGQLQDPVILARVQRTLGSAAALAAEAQRDLERRLAGREGGGER